MARMHVIITDDGPIQSERERRRTKDRQRERETEIVTLRENNRGS